MTARTCLWLFLQLSLFTTVWSTSFFIHTSGKAFCRSAELAKDTIVKVLFVAPDLVLEEGEKPTYLTITEKPSLSAQEVIDENIGDEHRHRKQAGAHRDPPPVSHELKAKEGTFVHTVRQDSEVVICIRATSAGARHPQRLSMRLEEMGDEEPPESDHPPSQNVDQHLSFMEQQFDRIESQMHAVLREADFARERDSIYHTKTDAMNKATIFWPIVHVGILLVTGFTQANHIVQFFKKRRII